MSNIKTTVSLSILDLVSVSTVKSMNLWNFKFYSDNNPSVRFLAVMTSAVEFTPPNLAAQLLLSIC